jgi:uncharacterized protein (TIGR02145 family)
LSIHLTNLKKIKMMKKKIFLPLLIAAMTVTMNLQAQVRIGEDKAPEKGAILDLNSAAKGGLLLPNVNIEELDKIPGTFTDAGSITASQLTGLVIYSLTPCPGVYVWDGGKWEKTGEPCPCPELNEDYPLCNTANTIADLNKEAGSGITWYDGSSGDTPRTEPINATTILYAELSGNCGNGTRIPVRVTLLNCSSEPTDGYITTFVNVMYDFQHQTIEAYNSGGDATHFTWQVSTGSTFVDIPGANSKYYTVPVNFYADAFDTDGILFTQTQTTDKSLNFRCVLENPKGTVNTAALNILFIHTGLPVDIPASLPITSGNYGIDEHGVRYLTLQKPNSTAIPTTTMNIALLNLGQSGTGRKNGTTGLLDNTGDSQYLNDAADLGDFYQWGRVADGHEHVVWSKNTSDHKNQILPMSGSPATSEVISRGTTSYDGNEQVLSGTNYYGKFIKYSSGEDWNTVHTYNRWGNGSGTDSRSSENPTWTYSSNNPCPSGWTVPSHWNFYDLFNGDGTTNTITNFSSSLPTSGTGLNNNWKWRNKSITEAIGGAIITNNTGDRVFLPAAGWRWYDGDHAGGDHAEFWANSSSSVNWRTASSTTFGSDRLDFAPGLTWRAQGLTVRCVEKF